MKPYYEDDLVTLYHGDAREVMAKLPAESVDAIVTSPPYAMQRKDTYGGVPETDYPAWTVAWMNEARRLLKPDGSVIINIRPHIKNGVISDYVLRTRLALRADGWAELEELIWHKPNGMPIGSQRRPRRSWESLHWFARHGNAWADPKAAGTPSARETRASHTTAARNGWDVGQGARKDSVPAVVRVPDVATFGTGGAQGIDHPAPFPVSVAEWCAKLICPPVGTILDPFSGSASTGVAAIRNGWHYIGIDAVEEYVEMSASRLAQQRDIYRGVA